MSYCHVCVCCRSAVEALRRIGFGCGFLHCCVYNVFEWPTYRHTIHIYAGEATEQIYLFAMTKRIANGIVKDSLEYFTRLTRLCREGICMSIKHTSNGLVGIASKSPSASQTWDIYPSTWYTNQQFEHTATRSHMSRKLYVLHCVSLLCRAAIIPRARLRIWNELPGMMPWINMPKDIITLAYTHQYEETSAGIPHTC